MEEFCSIQKPTPPHGAPAETDTPVFVLEGHHSPVIHVTGMLTGDRAVSLDTDGVLILWNTTVRLWPAWKCVSYVDGRSHPGMPTPLFRHQGAPLARVEMPLHPSMASHPGTPPLPLVTSRCAFGPPGNAVSASYPGISTPFPPDPCPLVRQRTRCARHAAPPPFTRAHDPLQEPPAYPNPVFSAAHCSI